jgi:argininosuccinate lyase
MANEDKPGALWGSRFTSAVADSVAALSKSTHFDWRLVEYDIAGSRAHVKALFSAGYLNNDEAERLNKVLAQLLERVQAGSFVPKDQDEDVHSSLERGIIEIAGADLGGKLRAGRSRNDQIATLIRSYLMD